MTPQAIKIGFTIMILGGILTGIGALPMSYGYYEFLRAVVPVACGTGVLLLVGKRNGLVVVYVVAALVFVLVKGLPKGVWALIDLALAGLLIYGGVTAADLADHSKSDPA